MPEASPRPSSDALPAKVSIAWGSTLLDVRHLPPGTHLELNDLRVEATAEGTRVMAGDEVLLAAGVGERVSKSLGGLDVTIEPPFAIDRVKSDGSELDVRFFKITAICLMVFFALVASFILTPTDGMVDGDIFGGPPVKLTVALPPEKTIIKKKPEFDKKPEPQQNAQPTLLQPKAPVDKTQKKAADQKKVNNLMASLFGGGFGRVLGTGSNNAIDSALNNLGNGPSANAGDGLAGMGARGTGPGGPGGDLSIGSIGGPGRPNGSPTGFGLNPNKKKTFAPGDGPREVIGNGLDKDVVMSVIRRHQSEIKFCYEKELQQNAKLAGKIAITWTIDATGAISDAQVAESGVDNNNVEACMLERIRRWKFPEPKGGGVVVITFPWVFHAAGSEE